MMMKSTTAIVFLATPSAVIAQEKWGGINLLQPYEIEKANAFKFESKRNSYIASHVLIRRAASLLVGAAPHNLILHQQCSVCGDAHGQPIIQNFPEIYVSLARRDGFIAAMACESPCSIDIENWAGSPSLEELDMFTPTERCWLAQSIFDKKNSLGLEARKIVALYLWARKECLIKLDRLTLDTMSFCDATNDALNGCIQLFPSYSQSRWEDLHFTEWGHGPSQTIGALATQGEVDLTFII